MSETTTIQITKDQHAELAARKNYANEPMKAVIGRLLEEDTDARNAEVADRLNGTELAIQELTDQVQSVKRTLEDLGGRR